MLDDCRIMCLLLYVVPFNGIQLDSIDFQWARMAQTFISVVCFCVLITLSAPISLIYVHVFLSVYVLHLGGSQYVENNECFWMTFLARGFISFDSFWIHGILNGLQWRPRSCICDAFVYELHRALHSRRLLYMFLPYVCCIWKGQNMWRILKVWTTLQ